jgi:hypothetical protein
MSDTEIAPNDTIPALAPLPGAAPLVYIPCVVDGQNWLCASVGVVIAEVAVLQPRNAFLEGQREEVGLVG